MQALVCQLCGSNDIVGDGEFFTCQHCGTKYTIEAARKMMIEGTVEVQGSVSIDRSSDVEGYRTNARRSLQNADWQAVEKYYGLIQDTNPHDIEAVFFTSFGRAAVMLLEDSLAKRQQAFRVLGNSLANVAKNFDPEVPDNKEVLTRICEAIWGLDGENYTYHTEAGAVFGIPFVLTDKKETKELLKKLNVDLAEFLFGQRKNSNKLYVRALAHFAKMKSFNPEIPIIWQEGYEEELEEGRAIATLFKDNGNPYTKARSEAAREVSELERKLLSAGIFEERKVQGKLDDAKRRLKHFDELWFFTEPYVMKAVLEMEDELPSI